MFTEPAGFFLPPAPPGPFANDWRSKTPLSHDAYTCHTRENAASGEDDAPLYAFAGTLFPTGHEPDDCVAAGAEGAQVIITDGTGATFTAIANRSGNFFLETATFTPPLRAKVVFQGRELAMKAPQLSGDCNSCHTSAGAQLAPGRILVP